MNLAAYFRWLAAKFFRRSQLNAEMEEELRSHIQHRADDLERSGLNRAAAERQARIEFGGQQRFKEECNEALGGALVETLIQDLRVSIRGLRKSPGFTITAILTLALAIGANAIVFSIMNAFIIRPLNVPHPESLYGLWRVQDDMSESYLDYVDLRDRNHSFDGLAAYNINEVGFDGGNNPFSSWVEEASGNYFDVLGLRPYLGRFFHTSDERGAGSAPYVVLTYDFWHAHFQDDPEVVGRVVQVNKHPFTVIGVAPPEFNGTLLFFHPDFFMPIINHDQVNGGNDLNARGNHWVFMTVGHLKRGVTKAQAISDLDSIAADLEKSYPKEDGRMTFSLARPSLYGDYVGGPIREFLTGLMLLAALILLAACANLGSLFAARAADRTREVAVRMAIGSSRSRILRGLFTEAVLLSLAGGMVGLWGSFLILRQLSVWRPFPQFPGYLAVTPDANVYAVALLLALASGFMFGAVPVGQILHTDPYQVIKSGTSSTAGGKLTLRDLLLVVQIAICAVLVTSSIVAVRGLVRSLQSDFGIDVHDTTLALTDLTMAGYSDTAVPTMQKRIIEALQAIPGVDSVGLADRVPLGSDLVWSNVFSDNAPDLLPSHATLSATIFKVSPEYLQAAGTELISGSSFSWHDDKDSPRVAVVNRQFAGKIFGSESSALGSYYRMPDGTRVQVRGIVEDGKYDKVTENPAPAMFLPILQWPSTSTCLVVRSTQAQQPLMAAIRSTVWQLDPGLPLFIQSWYKTMDTSLFGARMATIALGIMGFLGAMLAVTGIFGMAAYSVSRRMKELGIRIAIGAQPKEVLQAALGRALKLLGIGSAAGLLLGLFASRVLALIVSLATPRDPLVMAGVVVAMLLVGVLATWIPAQRALSIDPVILLREE